MTERTRCWATSHNVQAEPGRSSQMTMIALVLSSAAGLGAPVTVCDLRTDRGAVSTCHCLLNHLEHITLSDAPKQLSLMLCFLQSVWGMTYPPSTVSWIPEMLAVVPSERVKSSVRYMSTAQIGLSSFAEPLEAQDSDGQNVRWCNICRSRTTLQTEHLTSHCPAPVVRISGSSQSMPKRCDLQGALEATSIYYH